VGSLRSGRVDRSRGTEVRKSGVKDSRAIVGAGPFEDLA
jgi:hypothetical protein